MELISTQTPDRKVPMTPVALFLIFPLTILLPGRENDSIDSLIKKLGNGSFQQRQAATKALQNRPEAAPALRSVLQSPDPEIRRRAADILAFYVVTELTTAVKDGHIERVIEIVTGWPTQEHEIESWHAVRDLAQALVDRHQRKEGERIKLVPNLVGKSMPLMITAKRITENTKAAADCSFFVRAGDLDWDVQRAPIGGLQNTIGDGTNTIVAAGSVRIRRGGPGARVIFAAGNLDVQADQIVNSVIISCCDVTLDSDLGGSLVIARGKISLTGACEGNRLIAGKSVTLRSQNRKNIIVENDSNPLHFIRWQERVKDSSKPKLGPTK
jgi:hypothetical protein